MFFGLSFLKIWYSSCAIYSTVMPLERILAFHAHAVARRNFRLPSKCFAVIITITRNDVVADFAMSRLAFGYRRDTNYPCITSRERRAAGVEFFASMLNLWIRGSLQPLAILAFLLRRR